MTEPLSPPPLCPPPAPRRPPRWRLGWAVLLALLAALIAYLALTPQPPRGADLGWDKLNHAAAFASLSLIGCRACRQGLQRAATLLALLLFGAAIELIQQHIPGREGDWLDLAADALGLLIGWSLYAAARLWRQRRAAHLPSPP